MQITTRSTFLGEQTITQYTNGYGVSTLTGEKTHDNVQLYTCSVLKYANKECTLYDYTIISIPAIELRSEVPQSGVDQFSAKVKELEAHGDY